MICYFFPYPYRPQKAQNPINAVKIQPSPLQGEIIGMRMPAEDLGADLDWRQNLLHFDDGGMRGLACAVVWCALLHHGMTLQDDELTNPSMADLARSLLTIPTFSRSHADDEAADMIRRIIKQNVDSKKMAVSSYEWSQILKSMGSGKAKALTVADAIELYNCNPEIAAHGSSKDGIGWKCCSPQVRTIISLLHGVKSNCSHSMPWTHYTTSGSWSAVSWSQYKMMWVNNTIW